MADETARPSFSLQRPSLGTVVKAVLAAAALYFLVRYVDAEQLVEAWQTARPGYVAAAFLLLVPNLLMEAAEWQTMARSLVPSLPFRRAVTSLVCGQALGFFTPARIGEMAGRAFYLGGDDKWALGAAVFTQRLYDMVAAVVVGLVVLALVLWELRPEPQAAWLGVAVLGLGAAVTMTLGAALPRHTYALLQRVLPERFSHKARFLGRLDRRDTRRMLALVFVRYGIYVTQFVLLLRAFAPNAHLGKLYEVVVLTFYAKFLIPPVTFLDIGIREGAAVFFAELLGVPEAAALSAALLLFAMNILTPSALGIPFVLRLRTSTAA